MDVANALTHSPRTPKYLPLESTAESASRMLMMMNRQAVLSARLLTLSRAEDQWSKSIYWITADQSRGPSNQQKLPAGEKIHIYMYFLSAKQTTKRETSQHN